MPDFTAIIVYGPEVASTAAHYRESGLADVIEAGPSAGSLDLPPFDDGRVTLAFAHRVPTRWVEEARIDSWMHGLIEGLGIGRYAMGYPDIRGHGTYSGDGAVLVFSWFGAKTSTVLKVAEAVDRSYLDLAGGGR